MMMMKKDKPYDQTPGTESLKAEKRKGEVYAHFFTAILGSLPSRKLFIVPNSPS